jgi:hypothetical protein
MATIDPNIALGVRPVQIENPLNQLAAYSQIQSGQQGQQLNALKIREAEQEIENRNALRNVPGGINDPDYIKNVAKFDPKLALALQKDMALRTEADLKSTGLGIKNFTDSMSQYRNVLDMVRTPEQLLAWQEAVHKDPITGSRLASMGIPYDSVKQQLLAELQKPGGFETALTQSKLGATKFAELNKPNIQNVNRGSVSEQIQTPGMGGAPVVTRAAPVLATPGELLTNAREQQRINLGERRDIVASTSTAADGTVTQFNKFGDVINKITAAGKPSATFEKTAALQKQQAKDLKMAITEIEKAIEPSGLLEKSTGSGAGRAFDVTAGFFGYAPPGAIAAASLKPIADLGLKMIPRFEGPQSDKDTASYKQAAGELANDSLPVAIRLAAAKTVVRLMKTRTGQFVNETMATEGLPAGGPALPAGFTVDKP